MDRRPGESQNYPWKQVGVLRSRSKKPTYTGNLVNAVWPLRTLKIYKGTKPVYRVEGNFLALSTFNIYKGTKRNNWELNSVESLRTIGICKGTEWETSMGSAEGASEERGMGYEV